MTRILIFLCERWIPCQAVTSVLLHYRPETVHCSTKDANTSEITFLALKPLSHACFSAGSLTTSLLKYYYYTLNSDKLARSAD